MTLTQIDSLTPEEKELLLTKLILRLYELEADVQGRETVEAEVVTGLAQAVRSWIDERV